MACISNLFGCCQPSTQFVERKTPAEERISNVALLILFTCVLSIAVVALIIQYPAATKIFFSVGSVGAFISLVALTVLCMRKYGYCQKPPQNPTQVTTEEASAATKELFTPTKIEDLNPFNEKKKIEDPSTLFK